MKIYVNQEYEIKAINSSADKSLIETEVDREVVFGDMSDFMILNYCYKQDGNGYSIYPSSNYTEVVEQDYRIKVDKFKAKIFNLEEGQMQQDSEILINMMANTEMFEILLGMMPSQINSNSLNSKGVNPMVEVYVTLIIKGVKTVDDAPLVIREQVIERLKQLDISAK